MSSEQTSPTVFLSHSHADRSVARRLVRRLSAHGIKVWIDERELRLGATLTKSLRDQIQAAGLVLVIASEASAASQWVGLELAFAREHGIGIVPFLIDPVERHERFRDHLGVDATSRQTFADVVYSLMQGLYEQFDLEMPPADLKLLEAQLREVACQDPDLEPLISSCLDGKGVHQEIMNTVYNANFHTLDEALNALFDLSPNQLMASHAAHGFHLAGAGTRALKAWIKASGDGDLPLMTAVGKRLGSTLIPTAIKLLETCKPPNNGALYSFIDNNADQFDQEQRRAVLRLVTWPVRETIARDADVLAWVSSQHFPDSYEVQQMWTRWIHSGVFDMPLAAKRLGRYLADAEKKRLPGWSDVNEALRSHVRSCLRSRDREKVEAALEHIKAAANAGASVLQSLLREAHGVAGTAEWDDWRKSDPETAESMEWHVFEVAKEATAARKWSEASENAEKMVEFQKHRRELLAQADRESEDN